MVIYKHNINLIYIAMFDLAYYKSIKGLKTDDFSNDECDKYRKNRTTNGKILNMKNAELRYALKKNN